MHRCISIHNRPNAPMNRSELSLYAVMYSISALIQWCLIGFIFNNEDCRGAGARFPGGCPAYTSARDILILAIMIGSPIIFTVIIWLLHRATVKRPYRTAIAGGLAFLMVVSPFLLQPLNHLLPAKW